MFLVSFPLPQLNSLQLRCPSCSNLNCFPTFSWLWLRPLAFCCNLQRQNFYLHGIWNHVGTLVGLPEDCVPGVLGHVSGLTLSLAGAGQFNHLLSFTALVTCSAASSNIAKNKGTKLRASLSTSALFSCVPGNYLFVATCLGWQSKRHEFNK